MLFLLMVAQGGFRYFLVGHDDGGGRDVLGGGLGGDSDGLLLLSVEVGGSHLRRACILIVGGLVLVQVEQGRAGVGVVLELLGML
ncbi:MAG: hypothetical protein ACMG6E_07120 [Candidatus Roizmanbacteria bacterium]